MVYGMGNGMLADFEDGIDLRSSLTADPGVDINPIRFAWGTTNPVASRLDGEDDVHYYDVYNNDDGTLGSATYRLDIHPPQDWSAFDRVQVKSGGMTFQLYIVDAGSGATYLGDRTGNLTTHDLPAGTAVDEVVAVELRHSESTIAPGTRGRLHLRHIQLLEP
ncbi:MAG: hypothetical protein VX246_09485 [Myxococcota bacterium]|nr:hypothetical protein [Myxococcota bacterium]